jgi:uncharacterized membrane protein YhaH (DUF805 family)
MLMFEPLRKYATFTGRARRLEYWLWQVLMAIVFTALLFWLVSAMPPGWNSSSPADAKTPMQVGGSAALAFNMIMVFLLATLLPQLAVSVRRLHDSDKSGWWILLGLTGVGSLVLLIFYLIDGTRGPNRHGADPKGRAAAG